MGPFVEDDAECVHPQTKEDHQENASRNCPGEGQSGQEICGAEENRYFQPQHADRGEGILQGGNGKSPEFLGAHQLNELFFPCTLALCRRQPVAGG